MPFVSWDLTPKLLDLVRAAGAGPGTSVALQVAERPHTGQRLVQRASTRRSSLQDGLFSAVGPVAVLPRLQNGTLVDNTGSWQLDRSAREGGGVRQGDENGASSSTSCTCEVAPGPRLEVLSQQECFQWSSSR